jgi:hypothetical protein
VQAEPGLCQVAVGFQQERDRGLLSCNELRIIAIDRLHDLLELVPEGILVDPGQAAILQPTSPSTMTVCTPRPVSENTS